MFWVFQADFVSPLVASIHYENLVKLLEVKFIKRCGPLWRFYFSEIHVEPSAIDQSQFRVSCLNTNSNEGVCLWVSVLVDCNPLYWPVGFSSLESSGLPSDPTSLMDLRRAVCWAFHLLSGRSDDDFRLHAGHYIVLSIWKQNTDFIVVSIYFCDYR